MHVFLALNNKKILQIDSVNDLARLGAVTSRAAEALWLAPDRIRLIYQGRAISEQKEIEQSLYQLGQFQRCMVFEAVVLPPSRCSICSYARAKGLQIPRGRFVPGSMELDYCFLDSCELDDEGPFRILSPAHIQAVEDSRAAHESLADLCYCNTIASEYGRKSNRFWRRIIRALRRSRAS